MRFTFDKSLDYSQSRWANENSKKKTNCAKRGKTQVTRSHLIGWESGGKLDQSQWVIKYNHCNIEFLSKFNWKFLYILILTSWRGLTSMTNGSCTCSLSVSDGDGGRTVQPSSIHFVEAKEYVMVFIWRVTENKRKQQRVIMLSGSEKEKIHPFHWRKWAVLEDSTDLNLVILGWISKVIYDCFWFALLRSVIGPKHQHHLLNQSNSK